jgi:hypothetical protein
MRRGAKRLTEEKLHERRFAIDWSDLYQKKTTFEFSLFSTETR